MHLNENITYLYMHVIYDVQQRQDFATLQDIVRILLCSDGAVIKLELLF